jgi:hypothetical protein
MSTRVRSQEGIMSYLKTFNRAGLFSSVSLAVLQFFFLTFASSALAQDSQSAAATAVPPAPVPTQILASKKVFIANSVSDAYPWRGTPSVPLNLIYDEFYAALSSSGRFQLVGSPAESDLVFDLVPEPGVLAVRIADPHSNVTLWIVRQSVEPATLPKTARKNTATAMTKLIAEIVDLASSAH